MASTTSVPAHQRRPNDFNPNGANTPAGDGQKHADSSKRRQVRPTRWLLVALLVAAAIVAYLLLTGGSSTIDSASTEPVQLNTASVVRTDLVEIETFGGTLRTVDEETIGIAADGVLTSTADEGDVIAEGDVLYSVDGIAVPVLHGDQAFYRDLSLGDTSITTAAATNGTITASGKVGDVVEQGDVLYSFDGEPVVVLYGDVPVYRTLFWPEPEDDTTSSTLASDVQTAQSRQDLLDAIDTADDTLETAQADVPSNALLNAIDDLTRLEQNGASGSEINRANQAVATAQQADLDRIENAEQALDAAEQSLVDFDAVQAAADLDEVLNETETEIEANLVGPDVLQLETALVAMGYDLDASLVVDDEFTYDTSLAVAAWQRDLGIEADGIVSADDIVFVPGPAQILQIADTGDSVSPGAPVTTLAVGEPITGSDVRQLEQSLSRLGFDAGGDLVVDEIYTAETTEAVAEWQAASGQTTDGIVHLGDVVVTDAAVRVANELSSPGAELRAGEPVLSVTSVEQIVSFDLPTEDQSLVAVGDVVTVVLPDNSETAATVDTISGTATTTQDGETVFEVILEFDDPTVVGDLNEAPVDVEVIGTSERDVLAVPVSALIALADGSYAVEVESNTGYRLVQVDAGFFADGLVEIESAELAEGDVVRLP